jgi:hypothetical protein
VSTGNFNPTLPLGVEVEAFVPTAFYDSYMDCIRVFTHDRSVTEVRIADDLTLYRTNHRDAFDPQHVGFCLKGIRHMFTELELPLDGVLKLTAIIDALVRIKPQSTIARVLANFNTTFGTADELEVNLSEARLAA